MKNKVGSTPFVVLIFIGILVLLVSAGAYYYMQFTAPQIDYTQPIQRDRAVSETGISNQDDTQTIDSELNQINVGSTDADFVEIETELQEL